MHAMRWTRTILLSLLVLTWAACISNDAHNNQRSTADPGPANNGEDTPFSATLSPAAVHLQRDYESLRASHQKISDVWESLATGTQVRCGEYPDIMSPETISAEGDPAFEPLSALLHNAAIDIDEAINLWKAECSKPRANPSPDVIDKGRLAVRAAGDSLNQAQELLPGFQE